MHQVVVLLGGNTGNVLQTFKQSIALLKDAGFDVTEQSLVYYSKAWGFTSEHVFYNQVLILNTNNNPQQTLTHLLSIEKQLGRTRSQTGIYEDRMIDIDILFYDTETIADENLIVPHPRLHLRKFCLAPLLEIMPQFIHPVLQQSIRQLMDSCPDNSLVSVL